MKMKPLPSMKEKKRYLTIQFLSETSFSVKEVRLALEKAFKDFFGLLGLSKASIMIFDEKFNKKNQTIIVKVSHRYVDELKSSLILIKEINREPVAIKSITCSGTIKKASTYL